ncbi:AlpA family transcriptional regulator [Methyloceanibacter sp. wino2]|uniref:helix-turn-helix transcriptional regulator n=1 Tax=Methyloceanibacter sp. wino2 TaxID=2170729 RepID=UPI000D3E517A|nr:helix-turn-helix domain-containing protein [Methyloceanibacter sp. wino2]
MIRKKDLAKRLGVNPWTLDNWRRRGLMPPPIKITENMLFWRVSDIDAWLREKEAAHG